MGLACDDDGYDLRLAPCRKCGSRGCVKQDACDGKRARPKRSDYNYDSQGYCDNPGRGY